MKTKPPQLPPTGEALPTPEKPEKEPPELSGKPEPGRPVTPSNEADRLSTPKSESASRPTEDNFKESLRPPNLAQAPSNKSLPSPTAHPSPNGATNEHTPPPPPPPPKEESLSAPSVLRQITSSNTPALEKLAALRSFIQEHPHDAAIQQRARSTGNRILRRYADDHLAKELETSTPTDSGMNASVLTPNLHIKRLKPSEGAIELEMNAAMALLNPDTPLCCEIKVKRSQLPAKDKKMTAAAKKLHRKVDKKKTFGFVACRVPGKPLNDVKLYRGEARQCVEALAKQAVFELIVGKLDGIVTRNTPANNMLSGLGRWDRGIIPVDNARASAATPTPGIDFRVKIQEGIQRQLISIAGLKWDQSRFTAPLNRGITAGLERAEAVRPLFAALPGGQQYQRNIDSLLQQDQLL